MVNNPSLTDWEYGIRVHGIWNPESKTVLDYLFLIHRVKKTLPFYGLPKQGKFILNDLERLKAKTARNIGNHWVQTTLTRTFLETTSGSLLMPVHHILQ